MKPIYLAQSLPEAPIPCGSSRFWGNPDIPEDIPFPTFIDDEGDEVPYVFICQINLAELARFAPGNPLPDRGLLSFFAKIDPYMGYEVASEIVGGSISSTEAVKVLYFPEVKNLRSIALVDSEGNEIQPAERRIEFKHAPAGDFDDTALFAPPTHRQWESWDEPFENHIILLQVDSAEEDDYELNFMDCGVMDFLIAPSDLARRRFDRVRGIVLSS